MTKILPSKGNMGSFSLFLFFFFFFFGGGGGGLLKQIVVQARNHKPHSILYLLRELEILEE